jgi:hypothetical protein
VGVALASGVAAHIWLDDTRALFTAVELLNEQAEEMKRHG